MRTSVRIPVLLALTLALTVPALAQSTHQATPATPETAKAAPAVDQNKVDLLRQDYVAKTAELRGKITARQAELETLLATRPNDEAAVKKLVAEISALRGTLFEQTTLFRLRFAKETGMPVRMTRGMGMGMGGAGSMMQGMQGMGGGMDMCKSGGKSMPMGKMMMMDMQHGQMADMDHGAMAGMDHGAMPMPGAPAASGTAAKTPAGK